MVSPSIAVIISLVVVLVFIFSGIPIFISLGLTGFIGASLIAGPHFALTQLKAFPYVNTASYLMVVVPLFIIMGNFDYNAGITEGLYDFGHKWLSRLRGGVAMTTMIAISSQFISKLYHP